MELLIRINNKQTEGSPLFDESSQRGDLICACADGWGWTDSERTNPNWIIVHCDLADADIEPLLEGGRDGEPKWRRRLAINPDGLTSGASLTKAELMARVF